MRFNASVGIALLCLALPAASIGREAPKPDHTSAPKPPPDCKVSEEAGGAGNAKTRCGSEATASPSLIIPSCTESLGTVSIKEIQPDWWASLKLTPAERLLSTIVRKSGCLTVVEDQGSWFGSGLVSSNENNLSGPQRATTEPDYILVAGTRGRGAPEFAFDRALSSRGTTTNPNLKYFNIDLSITSTGTTSTTTREQWLGSLVDSEALNGAFQYNWSTIGNAELSSYDQSDVGRLLTVGYIDAYSKLVVKLENQHTVLDNRHFAMPDLKASKSSMARRAAYSLSGVRPWSMFALKHTANLYVEPTSDSRVLRRLETGTLLWLTGKQSGSMWQVVDALGDRGWINPESLGPRKCSWNDGWHGNRWVGRSKYCK